MVGSDRDRRRRHFPTPCSDSSRSATVEERRAPLLLLALRWKDDADSKVVTSAEKLLDALRISLAIEEPVWMGGKDVEEGDVEEDEDAEEAEADEEKKLFSSSVTPLSLEPLKLGIDI